MREPMDRNLAFELVRVTEAAALDAAHWMGRGNREAADQAAVDAMRFALQSVDMDGIVVIGEGEKDEAPMLFNGERVGNGNQPLVDVAVDPIDGTTLLANGLPNAISAVAIAERGAMFNPTGIFYMTKIAVGPSARGAIDINASPAENLHRIARAKGYRVDDLTVVVLDRDRHRQLISEIREAGARIMLISHGDIAGGLMPALEGTGIDVLMGTGGAPEAVVTACALKCMGGEIQCKLWPRNEEERRRGEVHGLDFDRVLTTDDLVAGDDIFFAATGVTDGELLRGVRFTSNGAKTASLAMRARSGSVRIVETTHDFAKSQKRQPLPYQRTNGQ
ncbi:MAG: class II fructose-bisphosphatase [Actinobacteria bacterium]|nr:class II fructose-bisphosphatase [Actinomycetota bacterium]